MFMYVCDWFAKHKAKDKGYFVEIGAYTGKTQNSTFVLEKKGWHGLCFEPVYGNFRKLKKRRKCECINAAVYDYTGEIEFVEVDISGWGGISESHQPKHKERYINSTKKYSVPCIAFNDAVKLQNINYLQIDVEGAESKILKSIDWNFYNIDYICIEDNLRVETKDCYYSNLMNDLGYKEIYFEKKDFLYEKI